MSEELGFDSPDQDLENGIAILAMSARFPGARNVEEFWQRLAQGEETTTFFSDEDLRRAGVDESEIQRANYVKACPLLEDVDLFDADFFDIPPREAELLDPQSRLFLECAWEALEEGGYARPDPEQWIGVFAGSSASSYVYNLWASREVMQRAGWFQTYLANDRDYFTTRISYKLDLKGPSVTVQTACSTSLVAVHQACQSLLDHQCTLALAGGVRVALPQAGYLWEPGGILSPDGHCRAFDRQAEGSLFGNGAGVVLLKRLDLALRDGDPIRAVIRGSAINNDGAEKVGFTAPGVAGQGEAVALAQAVAGVHPESIAFIEAHGSGTVLGDPIEVQALNDVFRASTERKNFCALGSVKSNFGHLEAAAGVAGLIKTVLALEHRQIPPTVHFEAPNPSLELEDSPFFVTSDLRDWPDRAEPRRAGVSSFGMGGTNAHLVLEEKPERPEPDGSRLWQPLFLSARTASALDSASEQLADHLSHTSDALADIAYTLQIGRRSFEHRRMVVAKDLEDARAVLLDPARRFDGQPLRHGGSVAFLLPGVGEQYVNMGRDLYDREPVFRQALDRCAESLLPILERDLRQLLFRSDGKTKPATGKLDLAQLLGRKRENDPASELLARTEIAQPAVFAISYALACLWRSWGIEPAALIGHSLGEYTAACLAGVLRLEDALRLVAVRAKWIAEQPPGAMLAVPMAAEDLRSRFGEELTIAAENGPEVCLVAGAPAAVDRLASTLDEEGVVCQRLAASHAFHSPAMEPVAASLRQELQRVRLGVPKIPMLSTLTGAWLRPEEARDANYWLRHLVEPVRFSAATEVLLRDQQGILLEVGPGQGLASLVRQHENAAETIVLPSLRSPFEPQDDQAFALRTLGRLWLAGVRVDPVRLFAGEVRYRVALPTYPFERRRYWIDADRAFDPAQAASSGVLPRSEAWVKEKPRERQSLDLYPRPRLATAYASPEGDLEGAIAVLWRDVLGLERVGRHDSFFDLGGTSLQAPKLLQRVSQLLAVELSVPTLFAHPSVAALAEVVNAARRGEERTEVATAAVDLRAEISLEDAFVVGADPLPESASAPKAVFLTGASGFLGAHLLQELLSQTEVRVHCLVRAPDDAAAKGRLEEHLASQKLDPALLDRVEALAGDLALPRFGLDAENFAELAANVDAVYHAGAWVNFTYPYAALAAANVGGTREAIRLATTPRLKPFHFISSASVFAPTAFNHEGVVFENDPLEACEGLFSGYAETKWVGEKILGLARERGLPVAIYRPGVISGHSRTGAGNTRDMVWSFLKGSLELGAMIEEWPALDVAPVDYVSRAIVHLSLQSESIGQAFHFPNPSPTSWKFIFSVLREMGYTLDSLPYRKWLLKLNQVIERGEDNALQPFLPVLPELPENLGPDEDLTTSDFGAEKYDGRHTARALENSDISCPVLDKRLTELYVEHFLERGFLPLPSNPAIRPSHDELEPQFVPKGD